MLGIDLVYLPEFKIKLKSVQLGKIFLEIELAQNKSVESLAGIFAAKEAFFKAVGKKEDWLSIWIEKNPPSPKASADAASFAEVASATKAEKAMADRSEGQGKPHLYSTLIKNNQKAEVSISHSGDYAVAVVIIL